MATTRTDDKLDKNITRLLMQSPLGLTIGDITAAAKCTPQTARKSLARIGADKDASGMLYVLRDDDEQAAPAPEPAPDAPEPEQAAPEPAPEAQMPKQSKLRTVNWGGHGFLNPYADTSPTEPTDPAPAAVAEVPEPLVWVDGATHYQPHQGAFYKRVSAHEWYVWSRIDCEPMHWCKAPGTSDSAEWVVRNQPTDPAPAAAQKPLRRGDLVMCRGVLWVVYSAGEDSDGEYWISSLTGDPASDYVTIDELTRIGSIRKKVKRLKAQMEGES